MCFLLASRKSAVFLFHLMTLNIYHMKFEVDESIRSWLITFLLLIRYVTLWPWLLTLQPWMFIVYRLSRIQTFYQIHRNPTIRGWFIDDWTNIFFLFLRGGDRLSGIILRVSWSDLHHIWRADGNIMDAVQICFRFSICRSISKPERFKATGVQNRGQISCFLTPLDPCKIQEG